MRIEYVGETRIGDGEWLDVYAHISGDTVTYRLQHVSDNPSTAPSPRGGIADILQTEPLHIKDIRTLVARA